LPAELDRRVLKAISKLGYIYPTLVQVCYVCIEVWWYCGHVRLSCGDVAQKQAIPLALEGKDLLVKAKTGSGKTAAYSIPLIHKILKAPATPGALRACGGWQGEGVTLFSMFLAVRRRQSVDIGSHSRVV
jgi:ATP-dependent RNA helicase DDX56/DBP9